MNEHENEQSEQNDQGQQEQPVSSMSQDSQSSEQTDSPNYEEIRPTQSEPTEQDERQKVNDFLDALFFLMQHPEEARTRLTQMKSDELPGSREENERYRNAIYESFRHHPQGDFEQLTPFDRDDSFWRQGVDNNGEEITAARPRMSSRGGKLSGESATLRVRAAAGLGTIINVPLWHTGIWLKLKAPSESTLLELERRIANEKVNLGRLTVGVAFTNTSVYINGYLVDMILEHVYDGTVRDLSAKNLKSIIKVTDIPQLVWGIACAIWPNGYRLERPCVYNPSVCNHVDSAHVNLSKLSWTDNRALSTVQRNHMANRDQDVSEEALQRYQDEHIAPQSRVVDLNDEMSIKLAVPSIEQYESSGYRWVDGIVQTVDNAFGRTLRGDERNEYILQQGTMSNLRRYAHWIQEIRFSDGSVADDSEDIDVSLDALTGDEKLRQHIISETERFIKRCVINAIGIPRYVCPSCGGEPPEDDIPHRLQEIIQLEINEIFFTLQYMRVRKIMESS